MIAHQGCRYRIDGHEEVIALETGSLVAVAQICRDQAWPLVNVREKVEASRLAPQPMRYYHGETA